LGKNSSFTLGLRAIDSPAKFDQIHSDDFDHLGVPIAIQSCLNFLDIAGNGSIMLAELVSELTSFPEWTLGFFCIRVGLSKPECSTLKNLDLTRIFMPSVILFENI